MPFEANDFQERYLRAVFAFIGIGDVDIIHAEGLALGSAQREAALSAARASISGAAASATPSYAVRRPMPDGPVAAAAGAAH